MPERRGEGELERESEPFLGASVVDDDIHLFQLNGEPVGVLDYQGERQRAVRFEPMRRVEDYLRLPAIIKAEREEAEAVVRFSVETDQRDEGEDVYCQIQGLRRLWNRYIRRADKVTRYYFNSSIILVFSVNRAEVVK